MGTKRGKRGGEKKKKGESFPPVWVGKEHVGDENKRGKGTTGLEKATPKKKRAKNEKVNH